MAVRPPFDPTTMSTTIIKLPPPLNLFSKQDDGEPGAGRVKLDFVVSGVSDLYVALKCFDKRFSNIWQDVTDPVRPSISSLSIDALVYRLCHDFAS